MSRSARGVLLCIATIAIAVGIASCMNWFTPPAIPTLIIGPVTIVGEHGEILLSVTDMPGGGLASMAADVLTGIIYDEAKVGSIGVVGLSGFKILAQQFDSGVGGFFAAHGATGLVGGAFVKLVFDVLDPSVTISDFVFDPASIHLGDDSNRAIAYQIKDDFAYYAR